MPSVLKKFLDETAQNISELKSPELEDLFDRLIDFVLQDRSSVSEEEEWEGSVEEVLKFCSASVLEMTKCKSKSAEKSLMKLFQSSSKLKIYPNYHVLINALTSTMVKNPISEYESEWIGSVLEAVISGLTAIESETISLSGSSLIKLLKWEREQEKEDLGKGDGKLISKRLAEHVDFVAILTADMCAMFSQLEEVKSAPFIRIVRFCELVIDVSDRNSGLKERIVDSVKREFVGKVYRTTLREMKDSSLALSWCNELLKACRRGNDLVIPLISEVFKVLKDLEKLEDNEDLIEILQNERSRVVEEIVRHLFTAAEYDDGGAINLIRAKPIEDVLIDDLIYRNALRKQLESFERFRIPESVKIGGLTELAAKMFSRNRLVLLNWLPYCYAKLGWAELDSELRMFIDISGKVAEYLDL